MPGRRTSAAVAALIGLAACGGAGEGSGADGIPGRMTINGGDYAVTLIDADAAAGTSNGVSIEHIHVDGRLAGSRWSDPLEFPGQAIVVVDGRTEHLPSDATGSPLVSAAHGLGPAGAVIGRGGDCRDLAGFPLVSHGFVWRPGPGGYVKVEAPGSVRAGPPWCPAFNSTTPYDMNGLGVMVGDYEGDDGRRRGFVGSLGALEDYVPSSAPASLQVGLRGINAHGELVGELVEDNGVGRAFVDGRDGLVRIEVPGATWSLARAISDGGVVAGHYGDTRGVVHGFLWQEGRVVTVDVPGATYTQLNGVNDLGQLAGTVEFVVSPGRSLTRGFVLTPLAPP
ncbi:MAG: hypothetical protein R3E48_13845 [Burkholderiaceae bacterium]